MELRFGPGASYQAAAVVAIGTGLLLWGLSLLLPWVEIDTGVLPLDADAVPIRSLLLWASPWAFGVGIGGTVLAVTRAELFAIGPWSVGMSGICATVVILGFWTSAKGIAGDYISSDILERGQLGVAVWVFLISAGLISAGAGLLLLCPAGPTRD